MTHRLTKQEIKRLKHFYHRTIRAAELIISILGNGLMASTPKLRAAVGETLEIGYQTAKPKALPI